MEGNYYVIDLKFIDVLCYMCFFFFEKKSNKILMWYLYSDLLFYGLDY